MYNEATWLVGSSYAKYRGGFTQSVGEWRHGKKAGWVQCILKEAG